MSLSIQFEATPDGNCLRAAIPGCQENVIEVYCKVPCMHDVFDLEKDERYWDAAPGVSDFYGYLTMKHAILSDLEAHGIQTDKIVWWYDTDEGLPSDAKDGEASDLFVDYEALREALEE